jgi:3-hydroxymyristoyl/3-hydroxydecanoyl-(acyl carrier protein) dehydratase
MGLHFRAFSFVDRITSLNPGVSIRGQYSIPSNLGVFPTSLVGEAIGQLAAWAAMAALDFRRRPIAGIAGMVEYLSPARPGQVLELGVDIESLDDEAVSYNGSASADGVPVIRLTHCVGPMMAVEELDDPKMMAERFALIRGRGAEPGGFNGAAALAVMGVNGSDKQVRHGSLHVPASADFFADHFPRKPIFPGSLLLHSNLELASGFVAELPVRVNGSKWKLRTVRDVKLRAFVLPGETLQTEIKLEEQTERVVSLSFETRNAKRTVGRACAEFVLEANT